MSELLWQSQMGPNTDISIFVERKVTSEKSNKEKP